MLEDLSYVAPVPLFTRCRTTDLAIGVMLRERMDHASPARHLVSYSRPRRPLPFSRTHASTPACAAIFPLAGCVPRRVYTRSSCWRSVLMLPASEAGRFSRRAWPQGMLRLPSTTLYILLLTLVSAATTSFQDLLQLGQFGDNGPNGNNTVFNVATMIGIKQQNPVMDQAANPQFAVPPRRLSGMFGEASFVLDLFANGTTKQATLPIVGSFFRNQMFPKNWFRAATPVSGSESASQISAGDPGIVPGRNSEQGVYVADPPPPAPFNASPARRTRQHYGAV
ncbi:hypothetical protein C8J57DRAFT_1724519 [Mycena rebaudengoi]|nr:hypothetical protein C8J57DRAFT_1724519 [Mycena rebaudengoi]